jgi:plastocyanin
LTPRRLAVAAVLTATLASALGATLAHAEIHEITVRNFEFDPATISINAGDTVRWVWESGSHTTTSGDPGTCSPDAIWDQPINMSSPTFERQFDTAGDFPYFCIPHCLAGMSGMITVDPVVGIDDAGAAPTAACLLRGMAPNPFTPRTSIRYELSETGAVRLAVYDASGHLVTTLLEHVQSPGQHAVTWDGRDASGRSQAAGIYFVRLEFRDTAQTRRVVLLR